MHHTESAEPRILGDHTWHNHAACRSTPAHPVDVEIFFPEPEEMDRIRAAKALCAQCLVRRTCLDAALENVDRFGIRGGMTEEEREPLHENLPSRLDYGRVNTVLAGRDIHLTTAERRSATRAAFQAGIPADRLAWLLKITQEHAEKLYRQVRRETRNRAVDEHQNNDTSWSAPAPGRDELGTAA
ncbi:WhiB family transcriptional regulator [Streptomyces sp. NPDC048172]|uniref:WhiB family transcriptional regulator n=1 Tax=Streptomyces sp. NPDC048172 TaxID=3365505 RepID=UPI0037174263